MSWRIIGIVSAIFFASFIIIGLVFQYVISNETPSAAPLVLTLSLLLFVSASYTPLPGASGAQEGGFMRYFDGIFPGGTKGLALLIWRFFTYYLFLFVGVITVLLEKAGLYGHARRQDTEPDQTEDTVC